MTNARRLGVAAVAGMMCVAGCGGGSKTDVPPSTISSTEQRAAAPSRAAQDLVLTAAELPPGFTAMDSDDQMTRSIVEQLTGQGWDGLTFSPAECRPVSMFGASAPADISRFGVIVGQDGKGEYFNEAVVAQRPDIGGLADYFRKCRSVQMTDGKMPMETTYTRVEGPRTRADELVVVEEKTTSSVLNQDAYLAYARVGEHAVWTRIRAPRDAAADRAVLDQLLTAAINKVADAS